MSLFPQPITGNRFSGGGYNASTGYTDEGSKTPITIQGSYQPTTGEDMQAIPENRRATSEFKIYTTSDLVIAKTDGEQSDEFLIEGEYHEVIQKSPWKNNLIPHYKYMLSKKEV